MKNNILGDNYEMMAEKQGAWDVFPNSNNGLCFELGNFLDF